MVSSTTVIMIILIIAVLGLVGWGIYYSLWSNEGTPVDYMAEGDEVVDSFSDANIPVYVISMKRTPHRYEYVTTQLRKLGIKNYKQWEAVDGFNTSEDELVKYGVTPKLAKRKGIAGCAASHISLWKHIRDNKLGWTLIIEDDAHFHPEFNKLFAHYWNRTPKDGKMVFPGFCVDTQGNSCKHAVIDKSVMCTHGYMVNSDSAKYLLDNIVPMDEPIDIMIAKHFRRRSGSYIFNDKYSVNGICPEDYRKENGKKCMFNGIIFQNHKEMGSVIHGPETVY